MRAVNLIPVEARRGGAGAPGRSGAGVYVLLGALVVLLVAVATYVLTTNSINARKGELARVTDEAARTEAQAAALKPYRDFADLRQKRLVTVAALVQSRFGWERTLRQLSRVLPGDISLTSLAATVSPGVSAQGGGGGGGGGTAVRGAVNAPAVELVGCAQSQSEVSGVMSRLRRMTEVTRVTLSASEKSEQTATTTTTAGGPQNDQDCRSGSTSRPQFDITVFFRPLAGAAAAAGSATPGQAAPASGAPAQPATPAGQAQSVASTSSSASRR